MPLPERLSPELISLLSFVLPAIRVLEARHGVQHFATRAREPFSSLLALQVSLKAVEQAFSELKLARRNPKQEDRDRG
jgi:hypothetical protein